MPSLHSAPCTLPVLYTFWNKSRSIGAVQEIDFFSNYAVIPSEPDAFPFLNFLIDSLLAYVECGMVWYEV